MDDTAALIPNAHRSVRWLDAQESAYAGELVTDGEQMRVRLPAQNVPDALWSFAGADHVVGIRDLVRTASGHDVLLPWCVDPVDVFLGRRLAAGQPLATGEAVTLVGSLLRGVAEITDVDVRGRWWLTDEARPMFAAGEGSTSGVTAVQIIDRVRDGCSDRMLDRVLAEIAACTEDPRVVRRSLARWEAELTELAAPRALVREIFPAERVSEMASHRERVLGDVELLGEQPRALEALRRRAASLWEALRDRLPRRKVAPAAAASLAGEAGERRSRADTAPRARRGRMLLVGAAVAGVVLGAGLLWPSDEESGAAEKIPIAATPTREATTPATDSTKPTAAAEKPTAEKPAAEKAKGGESEEPAADTVADGSVEQRVRGLLKTIAACDSSGDATCGRAIAQGAGEIVLQRLAPVDADRAVSPIEDYGDIAVVRLGAVEDHGEQMLVLVKTKDGWLVRDVYDVADQPSGKG